MWIGCASSKLATILPIILLTSQILIERIHTYEEGGKQGYVFGQRHTVSRPPAPPSYDLKRIDKGGERGLI